MRRRSAAGVRPARALHQVGAHPPARPAREEECRRRERRPTRASSQTIRGAHILRTSMGDHSSSNALTLEC
eukprot:2204279-Prymnesium_polylepis.1